jgi:DNA-binding CsgD family transcriptional regulator
MERLTPAERRALPYFVAGLDHATTAAALHLAPTTVKNHKRTIEDKLGVSYRELAAYAVIAGHVSVADIVAVWRQHVPQIVESMECIAQPPQP